MQEIIPRYEPSAPRRVNPYKVALRILWTLLLAAITGFTTFATTMAFGGANGWTVVAIISGVVTATCWVAYISSIVTILTAKSRAWEERNKNA